MWVDFTHDFSQECTPPRKKAYNPYACKLPHVSKKVTPSVPHISPHKDSVLPASRFSHHSKLVTPQKDPPVAFTPEVTPQPSEVAVLSV